MTLFPDSDIPPKKKYPVNGYAAKPGGGPDGKTCKGCRFFVIRPNGSGSKRFFKCGLMRHEWTSGYGSDIRANSPACKEFKESE